MTRALLAASAAVSSLLLAACGGGADSPGAPAADDRPVGEILASARACQGGDSAPFTFAATDLTALDDPLAYNAALSADFINAARRQPCVFTLPSGLVLRIDRAVDEAGAASPVTGDQVTVHYEGMLASGLVFDSSYARNEPATFPSDRLIAGWVEALPLMRVGEQWTLFIPPSLGYGERGTPGGPIGPNEALVFRMELLALPGTQTEPEAGDTE